MKNYREFSKEYLEEGLFGNKLKSKLKELGHKIIDSYSDFHVKFYEIKIKNTLVRLGLESSDKISVMSKQEKDFSFVGRGTTSFDKLEETLKKLTH